MAEVELLPIPSDQSFIAPIGASEIQTYTGRGIDPRVFRFDRVNPVDIAVSLSRLCRFNGHSRDFYSVAQHSVICAVYAARCGIVTCPADLLAVLLHDAHEAYTGDIVRPIKRVLRVEVGGTSHTVSVSDMERTVQHCILTVFGCSTQQDVTAIKLADEAVLEAERVHQMRDGKWDLGAQLTPDQRRSKTATTAALAPFMRGWRHDVAASAFYTCAMRLYGKRGPLSDPDELQASADAIIRVAYLASAIP